MTDSPIDKPLLEMVEMIGFGGPVPGGLKVHPDSEHIIYPVGCSVIIENMATHKKDCLSGHTNNVTCVIISKSGRYIASGQVTHQGFKAMIRVWDYLSRKMLHKMELHMVKIEALAFSPNDKYLLSLGGQDDGSVVVWNMADGQPICGSPAQVKSAGLTHTVAFANQRDDIFVTGGDNTLRVWQLDVGNRKIWPTDVNMGQLKREIKCIEIGANDDFFYCGTSTGDILGVNMTSKNFQAKGPKEGFSQGITVVVKLKTGELLVGAADGTICVIKENHNPCAKEWSFVKTKKSQKLVGEITSISLRGQGHQFFVGTSMSNIYRFNFAEFTHELITTGHNGPVNDINFALGTSNLFATCSLGEIRVWTKPIGKNSCNNYSETLRIKCKNMTCNAVEIMADGKSIISGWDDGRIRAFAPCSGKQIYDIENAHTKGVTALATMSDCRHIISGGKDGSLRVWTVSAQQTGCNKLMWIPKLTHSFKEHLDKVTCIKLTKKNDLCVSSSSDGTCIIWNLVQNLRLKMMRLNTLFNCVCYHPDEAQIITASDDRKIWYWDSFDATSIREVEGSKCGSINAMDISPCGSYFVSGSSDQMVKVWNYDEGQMTHLGIGHAAPVTRVKISPDGREIFSVSADGAIIRWRCPFAMPH